jgi:hypothetical protein
VLFVALDEQSQLLDGGDDDAAGAVLKLALQHLRRGIAVGRALLEAVVFAHRLIVEVFAIHHEQDFIDTVQPRGKLRRLEAGQRLAAAGGVPDVPAALDRPVGLVLMGELDAVQNPLGGDDLVGAHHQQLAAAGEHAVARQDVQQRVFGEKRLGEVHQIGDRAIAGVRPKGGELEREAGWLWSPRCPFTD